MIINTVEDIYILTHLKTSILGTIISLYYNSLIIYSKIIEPYAINTL